MPSSSFLGNLGEPLEWRRSEEESTLEDRGQRVARDDIEHIQLRELSSITPATIVEAQPLFELVEARSK